MDLKSLHARHIGELCQRMDRIFEEAGFDALVIHSGNPQIYFCDDHEIPFHSTPHFAHWAPLAGPGHLLCLRPGEKPFLVALCPDDFWSEPVRLGDDFWMPSFEIKEVKKASESLGQLPLSVSGKVAFHGDCPDWAKENGFVPEAINPTSLMARCDWSRSFKTDYEIDCIEKAGELAAQGFRAAKEAFLNDGSELEIHHSFVKAVGCVDEHLAFPSIVALNEKSAILHYPYKRTSGHGVVCLVDAGARVHGYASDITRTFTRAGCHATFGELLEGMNQGQKRLCEELVEGVAFAQIHENAHLLVGDLLSQCGVLKVSSGADAFERGLTRPFFPHGLGHFLGLQVHDVSGQQQAPEGGKAPPPENHPFLRTTRTMENQQVLTIEPGLYFIDLLLKPFRTGNDRDAFNWDLIDSLLPMGGIRIEDDVVVNGSSPRNLTRPFLP